MFNVTNNDITMTKGDSGKFNVRFKNKDGSEYVIGLADEVIFSLKRKKESFCPVIIEKKGCEIVFEKSETEKIPSGEYVYDVVLEKNGERATVLEGKFTIRKAVHKFE